MELLAIHIHPVDFPEEIFSILREHIGRDWPMRHEHNGVFVEVVCDETGDLWQVRQAKLEKSMPLMRMLDKRTIDRIRELAPGCDMRIVTAEDYIPLPASFVAECGRLGMGICIMNTARIRAT